MMQHESQMISLRSLVLSWENHFFSLCDSFYFTYFSAVVSKFSHSPWYTICGWHASWHHRGAI